MSTIVVRKLSPEKFARLRHVFDGEFDSDTPIPDNSEIFAAFEDGKMVGFVLAENIVLLGQIYVVPERREKSGGIVQNLLKFLQVRYDGRETVGAVASERRFEALYRAFGMQKILGTFFRKNIDF